MVVIGLAPWFGCDEAIARKDSLGSQLRFLEAGLKTRLLLALLNPVLQIVPLLIAVCALALLPRFRERSMVQKVNAYLCCFRREFVDYFRLLKHPASQLRMAHYLKVLVAHIFFRPYGMTMGANSTVRLPRYILNPRRIRIGRNTHL